MPVSPRSPERVRFGDSGYYGYQKPGGSSAGPASEDQRLNETQQFLNKLVRTSSVCGILLRVS